MSLLGQKVSYIEMYNYELANCVKATANSFFYAFEKNKKGIMLTLLNKNIDTSRINEYSNIVDGKVSGLLSYNQKEADLESYSRVYFMKKEGKFSILFKTTLYIDRRNPISISKIEFEEEIRLPRGLKRSLKKLENKKLTREEALRIAEPLKPLPPPIEERFFDINLEKDEIYASIPYWWSKPYFLSPALLNETMIPISIHIDLRGDSMVLPTQLYEYDNLEKLELILGGKKLIETPYGLRNLNKLKFLSLSIKSNASNIETNIIPKSIGKLSKLEVLIISCQNCVDIPSELENLRNLKKFDFHGNRLNSKSKILYDRIKSMIRASNG